MLPAMFVAFVDAEGEASEGYSIFASAYNSLIE
jgi:hypothetical protein